MKSADVRQHLVRALNADLVGPFDSSGQETLSVAPSRIYLTGFLAPREARESKEVEQDGDFEAGDDVESDDAQTADPQSKRRGFWPASIGMSFLLEPGDSNDTLSIRVRFATYAPIPSAPIIVRDRFGEEKEKTETHWTRISHAPDAVVVPLDSRRLETGIEIPGAEGLKIKGIVRTADFEGGQVKPGTRTVSIFLVNERKPAPQGTRDAANIFQVEMRVQASVNLVPRPNLRAERSTDWDDNISDLQFRDVVEYGVGHGIAVETIVLDGRPALQTTWLPMATVKRVTTHSEPGVETSMEALSKLQTADVRGALARLPEAYAEWISLQKSRDVGTSKREVTRESLMNKASDACDRIRNGIRLLETDPDALLAFRIANAAMARAARQRSPDRYNEGQSPSWRLFQLAFVLLNLDGVTDPEHPDREKVELIFFPTGGGKTEAYLGVVAYALALRRLKGRTRPDHGYGVAILLRYTLRLLTLDQLGRAASLICALEMIRKEGLNPGQKKSPILELGDLRFSIGLWVGSSATANTLQVVSKQITDYKISTAAQASSPFPLTHCPWCQKRLEKSSFELKPNKTKPEEVIVGCSDFKCDFNAGKCAEGLPILFVDEQIYAELPSFIIATVDKFALLPWRGETAKLFGRAHSYAVNGSCGRFFSVMDSQEPNQAHERIPHNLLPPELIIQDELHLIAGPLGTMVGLYETAIETLCQWSRTSGKPLKPKIIASTATVKRARQHTQALFGRTSDQLSIFPPRGIDDAETYFSTEDHGDADTPEEAIRRMYVGVAAQGRSMKNILLRVYTCLMNAANYYYQPKVEGHQAADPYMTVAGYFNSLRELGGMRRLVEDDVRARCAKAEERRPISTKGPHPYFKNRNVKPEPIELTSRESTSRITQAKSHLEQFRNTPEGVDVVLASNMISVGVDIDRLGLMVVASQPKTTSEYIQASSRVGRDPKRPGLVVTCYNLHKSRDRSHFEHFVDYHQSFYRHVEATSLTPFSGPALDRGFAGVVVALTRLMDKKMVAPSAVLTIHENRRLALDAVRVIAERAALLDDQNAAKIKDEITKRGEHLIDQWENIINQTRQDAGERRYSPWEKKDARGKSLIFDPLSEKDEMSAPERLFAAPTSMRDVEPSVHIWVWRGTRKDTGGEKNG